MNIVFQAVSLVVGGIMLFTGIATNVDSMIAFGWVVLQLEMIRWQLHKLSKAQ